nr:carboxypeptidase-like regulatory domain-containing protein [Elizabethkingia bruuniana]
MCVFAQTITGTVYSKGSQEVVPYAKIGIVNENIGIQADEKGQYTLKLDNVSRDKQLMILVGGYETYKVTVADFIKIIHILFTWNQKLSTFRRLL